MINKFVLAVSLTLGVTLSVIGAPHLVVLPDGIVDLGEFEEKEVQTREVYVKNTGDEPLTILKTFASCSCTRVQYSRVPIAPAYYSAVILESAGWDGVSFIIPLSVLRRVR